MENSTLSPLLLYSLLPPKARQSGSFHPPCSSGEAPINISNIIRKAEASRKPAVGTVLKPVVRGVTA